MALLTGKKVLIMGVANVKSIGWGIAQQMAQEGALLAFTYQAPFADNLKRLVSEGLPNPEEAMLLECDVADKDQVQKTFDHLSFVWGNLDAVVFSIAFGNATDLNRPFSEIEWEGYALAMQVSAHALLTVTRFAAPLMNDGGSIVYLTFDAADRPVPGYHVMAPAKAALETNGRYLAAQYGPRNIRVNGISSGPIRSLSARAIKSFDRFRDQANEASLLHRPVGVEEVGKVAVFLASHLSSCVTGAIIPADNGLSLVSPATNWIRPATDQNS